MRVRVVAFASAAEVMGGREREVELPEGSSVAELRGRLEERHPELEGLWERLAVAVNGSVASGDSVLADGAEVALLPPVSGG